MADMLCEAMLSGAPQRTSDAGEVEEYADRTCVAGLGVTTYVGVPVVVHGSVVGTLCGVDRDAVMVAPDRLELLTALGAVIQAHVETGTVLRHSASGWQVGPEDDLDLTTAMSLAEDRPAAARGHPAGACAGRPRDRRAVDRRTGRTAPVHTEVGVRAAAPGGEDQGSAGPRHRPGRRRLADRPDGRAAA
jgi:hypothetical protein